MRRRWRQLIGHVRNLIIRLTITYVALAAMTALPGIRLRDALFCTWIASLVFVLLTRFARPLLLALTLPLTITTAGLFIFVIDGILLLLTDLLTGLEIAGLGWAVVGSIVMGIVNIWVESGFKRLGWLEREKEQDPLEITSPGWALRILLGLGLLLGIVFSALMAYQVGLALSALTANLAMLGVAAIVTLLLVSMGVSWLVAEGLEAAHRARFTGVVGGMTTAAGVAGLALIALAPVDVTPPPEQLPETAYWRLSTGSRVAYYPYPATYEPAGAPVVYLHDGPGFCVLPAERAFYRQIADLGYDVYLYDRAGTGRSDRLESIEDYGTTRDIADLDAVRDKLGVHEMILIGQGDGAELAARYLSRFPERVQKAIFLSPAPLSNESMFRDFARTAAPTGFNTVIAPRLLLAEALTPYGPRAAQRLASQEEMSLLLEQAFDPRAWVCASDADRAPLVEHPGFNAYVALRSEITARALPDPRPRLADNLTASLLVAGECDYLPWDVIREYQAALLSETVFYIEGAGHMIPLTRADLLADVIRSFLLDELYPIDPYAGPGNPRPPVGP
ncbi:MAG: alpha/beta fold hydrolase [Anaerolineae bacterium]